MINNNFFVFDWLNSKIHFFSINNQIGPLFDWLLYKYAMAESRRLNQYIILISQSFYYKSLILSNIDQFSNSQTKCTGMDRQVYLIINIQNQLWSLKSFFFFLSPRIMSIIFCLFSESNLFLPVLLNNNFFPLYWLTWVRWVFSSIVSIFLNILWLSC